MSLSPPDIIQRFRPERFTRGNETIRPVQPIDEAAWIGMSGRRFGERRPPSFARFRRSFKGREEALVIDISADARFVLFLDGAEIARGPHQGIPSHWHYETYEISGLAAAAHVMEAVVFDLSDKGPLGLLSAGLNGFILKASGGYDDDLTTGRAEWEVAEVAGTAFGHVTDPDTMTGAETIVRGTGFLDATAAGAWRRAAILRGPMEGNEYGFSVPGPALFPSTLPDQTHEGKTPGCIRAVLSGKAARRPVWRARESDAGWTARFNALFRKGWAVRIPARTTLRVLWDLDDYFCAYPLLETSGGKGARIRWSWAETLYEAKREGHIYANKGNRDEFDGKTLLRAMRDTFYPNGRRRAAFTVPWWKAGRWIEIAVRTGAEPLVLRRLAIAESRYPLESVARFECDDPSIAPIARMCVQGMQSCLHETFMDCPYFEQQMYPGDTRVQMLILNAVSGDPRPVRFGMGAFDFARRENGLVPMAVPSRNRQESATYSLSWAMMAGDYALWHGADDFLRARLPGLRHTLDGIALYENADGLLENLPGWSFVDWAPEWGEFGNAPDGRTGLSAVNNLLYVHALQSAAKAEAAAGDAAMAARWRRRARAVGAAILARFWDNRRGLVADTAAKNLFSEHAQCLALLAGVLPACRAKRTFRGLIEAPDLARCTVYFTHYLFETFLRFGRADLFLQRLDLWRGFVRDGLKTPLEAPGWRGRSDCHAWGAHPLYHLQTGIAGIRPAANGFAAVEIAPQFGPLTHITASMPTPKGHVSVNLRRDGDAVSGTISVPPDLPATFILHGHRIVLHAGVNEYVSPPPGGPAGRGRKCGRVG